MLGWRRVVLGVLAAAFALLLWTIWPASEWRGRRTTLRFTLTATSDSPIELVGINIDGVPVASSQNIPLQYVAGNQPYYVWRSIENPIGRENMHIEVMIRVAGNDEITIGRQIISPPLEPEMLCSLKIRFYLDNIVISECFEDQKY